MSQPAFPGGLKGEDPDLTDPQRQIFTALLEVHRRTAQAVGSEALCRMSGIRRSPAGIRSTLAELEDLGLLARAHVSAGRVPSPAGYAFFVRSELTPDTLPVELLREVDERLRRARNDVEELLAEASRLLSELTEQLGLAVTTRLEEERLDDVELEPLGLKRTLLVLSLGHGATHTLALDLETPLGVSELAEVAGVLRERLRGVALSEVRERFASDPDLVRDTAVRIVARAATASWSQAGATTLFRSGTDRFATQPEFADRAMLGSLLRVLETGAPLDRLMVESVGGQPSVRVALDEAAALAACSLVSYPLGGMVRRAVGVLGPLRMDYARCVGAVEAVGARVEAYL